MRIAVAALLFSTSLPAQVFYPDDPLVAYPAPRNVEQVRARKVNEYYDFFQNLLFRPGDQVVKTGSAVPARGVNTLGEVLDSEWYTNRHGRRRMSLDELRRGPGDSEPPSMEKPWRVVSAKTEGITPGFTIVDGENRRYLIKLDPPSHPELASAADVIASKFLYALGYNVPENYIVRFYPEQLVVDANSSITDHYGKRRRMTARDLDEVLARVKPPAGGSLRALASRFIPGKPVGPFRYHGTRADDPNDTIQHEHRRDLRGLRVFAAWLGHDDSRSINTLDTLVEENGVRFIRHYLIDFGSTLGSATNAPNSPRSGGDYLFAWGPAARQFLSLGFHVPAWAKAKYPDIPAAGKLEYTVFDPEQWVPEYPNPAFTNMDAQDAFWAARQVMAFTDEEVRAIVQTGEYGSRQAEDWIVKCLIERRNKIGRAFFRAVLPVDGFTVANGRLEFSDLAAAHFGIEQAYSVRWYRFENRTGTRTPLAHPDSFELPAGVTEYLAAEITGSRQPESVTVYIRNGETVVGVERGQQTRYALLVRDSAE